MLVGCGTLFSRTLEAARQLEKDGLSATVINHPFVNRVDTGTIGALVESAGGRLVTIEDHQICGGMGAQLSHALSRQGVRHRIRSLGIDGQFGQSAYKADHLYQRHGLTARRMAESARELVDS